MDQIKILVQGGKVDQAKFLCQGETTPVASMIAKGLERIGSPLKNIEVSIENVGKIEIYKLGEKPWDLGYCGWSSSYDRFPGNCHRYDSGIHCGRTRGREWYLQNYCHTGIYEAMITTAAGLVVGIIAYLGYNYLVSQVSKLVHSMEYTSVEFIDLLQDK
jgi:biopolymer transport protein ExbB